MFLFKNQTMENRLISNNYRKCNRNNNFINYLLDFLNSSEISCNCYVKKGSSSDIKDLDTFVTAGLNLFTKKCMIEIALLSCYNLFILVKDKKRFCCSSESTCGTDIGKSNSSISTKDLKTDPTKIIDVPLGCSASKIEKAKLT
ncbi:uncharacterized protein LOC136076802 isoform X2 [Hydra vulgaris]|uniref:Uncharacterized protein LOC136076802 isoform X2 n=1 Tax=Hydra vulgaris TaxID=6087 RepID=A0ABM4BBM6_HYDVU